MLKQCSCCSQIPRACLQALEEGTATVRLQPSNAVQQVAIAEHSIPIDAVQAGTAPAVAVQLATEDGKAVQYGDALQALQLCIIAPGGNSRNRQARSTSFRLLPSTMAARCRGRSPDAMYVGIAPSRAP